jgi:hypothetical protein
MPPFTTFLFLIAFSLILMVASCWFFVCLGHFYKVKKKKKKQLRKEKGNTQGVGVLLKLALALGGAKEMLISEIIFIITQFF